MSGPGALPIVAKFPHYAIRVPFIIIILPRLVDIDFPR
jgi:hypothetical protein